MARKNIPDARNRILQAAIKIFAAKSFEGSRIEEIAQAAKVPKSLIYYHFQSKDAILEVLLHGFIREYTELLQIAKHDTHQTKAEALPDRSEHHYQEFMLKNIDLIRILLIDSFKKETKQPLIFRIVEALIDTEQQFALAENSRARAGGYDRNERLIAEFFTNLIPLYAFLCFHDAWLDYFGIGKQEFEALCMKIYGQTHGAYHQNHP